MATRPMTAGEPDPGKPTPKDPVHTQDRNFKVSDGGPWDHEGPSGEGKKNAGWNGGDIDFAADGSIFIRNPYLADAIERQLKENAKNYDPTKPGSILFRLYRDEGWSGEQQNIIC
jgi:hypothetical protein